MLSDRFGSTLPRHRIIIVGVHHFLVIDCQVEPTLYTERDARNELGSRNVYLRWKLFLLNNVAKFIVPEWGT